MLCQLLRTWTRLFCHHVNHDNWAHTHQCWLRQQWNSVLFFDELRSIPFIGVMAGFEVTLGEMNVMPTVAYLNKIILGVGVLSGWALDMAFALISSLSKGIWMPYATEMIFLLATLFHCCPLRANNIAFVYDWPARSPDLNLIEHLWDNLDQVLDVALFHHQTSFSLNSGTEQHSTNQNQYT